MGFSFVVPNKIQRDTLYVHAQVEITLVESGRRRRMILSAKTTNKISHFGQEIGIKTDTNNDYKPSPPQQPHNNKVYEPIRAQPQPTNVINLSSPIIVALGCLLAAILTAN